MADESNPSEFHHESIEIAETPSPPVYDDTYDKAEVFPHGGRPWVEAHGGQQKDPSPLLSEEPGFTVLTYNVFADCKCQTIRYSSNVKWETRRKKLIDEIASYNADILCLQDVDHFSTFWRPQLMLIGYDSLYKKRTSKRDAHYEGVVIAYRRDILQLFKSEAVEFNKAKHKINTSEMGSSFKERMVTDDVGLICFLQPWGVPPSSFPNEIVDRDDRVGEECSLAASSESSFNESQSTIGIPFFVGGSMSRSSVNTAMKTEGTRFNCNPPYTRKIQSGICVATAMLSSRPQDASVRYFQAQYLARCVERSNKEFQLPVVMGVSLFDSPTSGAYTVLRTGRIPLKPQAPRQPEPPVGDPYCRGSCTLKWKPPHFTKQDPPILKYKLAWRPGGSRTLGFRQQIAVDPIQCLAYEERTDEHGVRKVFQKDNLEFNITGLTSDLPYEFIVTAVNEIGEGIWSNPSMPVVMPNPERAPPMPDKKVLLDTQAVRELREGGNMHYEDMDVELAINSDPITTATGMTPRLVDGRKDPQVPKTRILPLSVNPREGWKSELMGGYDERVRSEITTIRNMEKTILRDRESGLFLPNLVDSPRGKRAMVVGDDMRRYVDPATFTNAAEKEQEKWLNAMQTQHSVNLGSQSMLSIESEQKEEEKLYLADAIATTTNTNIQGAPIDGGLSPSRSQSLLLMVGEEGLDQPHSGLTKTKSVGGLKVKMRHHQLDFMGHFKQQTFDKTVERRVNQRGRLEVPSLISDFNSSQLDLGNSETIGGEFVVGDGDDGIIGKVGEDGFERTSQVMDMSSDAGLLRNGKLHSQETKGFGFGPGDTATFEATATNTATFDAVEVAHCEEKQQDYQSEEDSSISTTSSRRVRNGQAKGHDARLTLHIKREVTKKVKEGHDSIGESRERLLRAGAILGENSFEEPELEEDENEEHEGNEGEVDRVGTGNMADKRASRQSEYQLMGDSALHARIGAMLEGVEEGSAFESSNDDYSRTETMGTGTATKDARRLALMRKWEERATSEEQEKLRAVESSNLAQMRDMSRVAARLNDDTLIDGQDLFYHIGKPHHRTLHDLCLRSAYEQYSSGGEPLFTTSHPAEGGYSGVQCQDFIFYSQHTMLTRKVLALPDLSMLEGMNPRETLCRADPWSPQPSGVMAGCFDHGKQFEPKNGYGNTAAGRASIDTAKRELREKLKESFDLFNRKPGQDSGYEEALGGREEHGESPTISSYLTNPTYWTGIFAPLVDRNERKTMHWLPNDEYNSAHLALVAHVGFIDGALGNEWV